jgi:hypothetical protein
MDDYILAMNNRTYEVSIQHSDSSISVPSPACISPFRLNPFNTVIEQLAYVFGQEHGIPNSRKHVIY